jgi:tRNA/tmRNA/rRNA uracil-C5-methylase (TrmA/RlmC/RlmD family)
MSNTVRIDSMAYGGSGVGRIEGKVVFIPLTAIGDLATFRPVREKKGYLEGELVEVIEASPLRREAYRLLRRLCSRKSLNTPCGQVRTV